MENKYFHFITEALASINTLFNNKILYPTLMILLFLMIVDYLSGMWASKKEALEHSNDPNYGWSSKKVQLVYTKRLAILFPYV